ncbi:MAG TPA: hypothetical protein VHT03_12290 [Rhizomicrobium sp.]|nr:hypothetical protein [Rhizomicrobium sp.]
MKFTLIYDGDLPSSGNRPKPIEASNIRNHFHDQLRDLWDSHVVLRKLARTARVHEGYGEDIAATNRNTKWDYRGPIPPVRRGYIDLCAPIFVPSANTSFVPLIRNSLHLASALEITFLRHEEPFALMKNGGDLDGRLATLFDALQMPNPKHEYVGSQPTENPLYTVLEDDALISDFSIRSGRLLGERTRKPHAVRLQVDVTIKVLRVTDDNQSLIGG